jgi:2-oxoglutarate dehydrogenase E2 component (dihydrolipoamide succinyltransferase)
MGRSRVLAGLARAIVDIAARARSGDLALDELSGGTFTFTNIGSEVALFDTPILMPPQAAILATGAIRKQPRVVFDSVGNGGWRRCRSLPGHGSASLRGGGFRR